MPSLKRGSAEPVICYTVVMMNRCSWIAIALLLATILYLTSASHIRAQAGELISTHLVEAGDTWTALAWRYGIEERALRSANPHPNRQRQPAIGQELTIPSHAPDTKPGLIINLNQGGLLQQAVITGTNPWRLALENRISTPYQPLLYRPIYIPLGSAPVKQLPGSVRSLEVNRAPAMPGQALGVRALNAQMAGVELRFSGSPFAVFVTGPGFVALSGTGAFFEPGDYPLEIQIDGEPLWVQPWRIAPGQWSYDQITYTGAAAAIDADAIRQERERLAILWAQVGDRPLWPAAFSLPIVDYLEISSDYGARRSYSGGPYDRYHEGLDFSAYGSTPVYAPAGGNVALAEELYVRGGAVILDHGLGIYSGFYHLSEVLVDSGQSVSAGQIVGRVGSSGLSTGNHLHWDLLVDGIWVSPAAWLEQDMACWILEGWGTPCSE